MVSFPISRIDYIVHLKVYYVSISESLSSLLSLVLKIFLISVSLRFISLLHS